MSNIIIIKEEKNKEKNKENDLDEEEEELEENDIIPENNNNKDKIPVNENNLYKRTKKNNERLSCQSITSFIKRQSNYSIRSSKTRKKTAPEYFRNSEKSSLLSPLAPIKQSFNSSIKSIKSYNFNRLDDRINNKRNSGLNNYMYNNMNTNNSQKKGYIKIQSGNLNIYERSKKNKIRKENIIKKKKEQQLKEIIANSKGPTLNRTSEEIMENHTDYVPIQERAIQLHNKHLVEIKLHEKKIENKKIEEEKKDYEIVKYYASKRKTFNEKDWEIFIKNQEYWNREKQYKKKAAQIFRDNMERKIHYRPEIDLKSKKMVEDRRKNELFNDDIHTRLYNDFNNLQERKRLRMNNSMPSFKPLINKTFNKNIFQTKKKYDYTNNFDKKLESLIDKKLKKIKNANSHNQTKFTSQSFVNNTEFKMTNLKFIFNNNSFNNTYNNTKKIRYDDNYLGNKVLISNNYGGNILTNKSQNLTSKLNFYDIYNKNKGKNINKNKNNFYMNNPYKNIGGNITVNKSKNPYIFSKIIKEEN